MLPAQSAADIISSLGLQQLSPAGQDTVVHYYRTSFDDLFSGTIRIRDPLMIPEESQVVQDFFRDKLSTADVELIRMAWEDKYQAFSQRTLVRAEAYREALRHQKLVLDSLDIVYGPRLEHFRDTVLGTISEAQFRSLQDYFEQSLQRLRKKRDEFLRHEQRMTKPITSSLYDYFEYSFGVMERLPASYYYNRLGATSRKLNFAEELPLKTFYLAYEAFENALIETLDEQGGRAHVAIPAYYSGARYQGKHTRINALLYALLNWHP